MRRAPEASATARSNPAILLARTLIEMTQTAGDLGRLLDEGFADDDLDSADTGEWTVALQVAARFANVTAWMLRAAAGIHPAIRNDPPRR
jgi:hypothetical protein